MKDAAKTIKSSFNVNNFKTSVSSEAELNKFVAESQTHFYKAKYELHAWASNITISNEVLNESNNVVNFSQTDIVTVLGILWYLKEDTLCCNISSIKNTLIPVTKKSLLSVTHKVFDPIGFTCPFTMTPKFLLQKV